MTPILSTAKLTPNVYYRTKDMTHDPTTGKPYRIVVGMVKTWIMQRISIALMQGMAACIHERLDNIQRERTPPEFRDLPPLGQDGFGHG